MQGKVLIVDDDKELSEITAEVLQNHGYITDIVYSSEEAYSILEKNKYNLIILDINLSDGTGFEICKELRKVSRVPVIFASARTNEDDKIVGLDIGGDDYITKPYSLKELLARVNALFRRTYPDMDKGIEYKVADICVNTDTRRVTKAGRDVKLSLKEYDLLQYMCEHKGEILSKETLLNNVWGSFSVTEISTVVVHIRWLREKLEDTPSAPQIIKTLWGVGYTFSDKDDDGR